MSRIPSKAKRVIRGLIPNPLFSFIKKVVYPERIYFIEDKVNNIFKTHHANLYAPQINQKQKFQNAEFKVYSKHGNDGILLFLFSRIGVKYHTFVEIGTENGKECNTSNLSLNFGWSGLMVDGSATFVEEAKKFFKDKLGKENARVSIVQQFVTAENINQLLKDNVEREEIDLFSLDIDGNDYWVWKAIDAIKPRVVVLEYNAAFSLNPVTVKYNPEFQMSKERPLYFGASLTALSELSKKKGYALVACDSHGHDAFFVREDLIEGVFEEQNPADAFYPNPHTLATFGSLDQQFALVKRFDLEYV